MKITLTGINFNYSNGFESDYTGVSLNFVSSGATFNLNGYVTVTKDQYIAASGDLSKLTDLIKQSVLDSINGADRTDGSQGQATTQS